MILKTSLIILVASLTWIYFSDYFHHEVRNNPKPISNQLSSLYQRDYTAFTCWLSCQDRATVMCEYKGTKDVGNAKRPSKFNYDPVVGKECQQKSLKTYNSIKNGWDLGHMVAANHLDLNEVTIKESMYITNIMPQTSELNRGAYLAAEEIFECWRDVVDLNTLVGIIMGNDESNDHFVGSHGVRTPDYYWRIIEKESDGDVIAWIFPNNNSATKSNLGKFLVRIADIEEKTGFYFEKFSEKQRNKKADALWPIPLGCDKS